MVQLDTLHVCPVAGKQLKQFSARDVVSKCDVAQIRSSASAHAAAGFIERIRAEMPFPVKAIQVDGGSEFYAQFERTCRAHGIRLFTLPPRSPKLNGVIERAQRTYREEFYRVYECSWTVAGLDPEIRNWTDILNTIRLRQPLNYRTPLQYLHDLGIVPDSHPPPSQTS